MLHACHDRRCQHLAVAGSLTAAQTAAGRFITDGGTTNLGLLQRLNNPRFLFHSFAPLLSAAGINVASQAGVPWASSLAFSGEASPKIEY